MEKVERSIEVQASVEQCYQFWSRFEYLPRIMEEVKDVHRTGPLEYRWRAEGALSQEYEWDARLTALEQNSFISWESTTTTEPSRVVHRGSVRFEPVGQGCRVYLVLEFAQARSAGEIFERLTHDLEHRVETTLGNFRDLIESRVTGTRH